jgi:cyclopropane fatty-acyl-phospholipid synthase-like methyltransferase
MDQTPEELVAKSMDANLDVSSFVPELVADMWALGSTPHVVVDLLRPLGLPAGSSRIIDLGCGKGALGITVAKELGLEVLGVDLSEVFLAEARQKAEEHGVASLCQFEQRDLHDVVRRGGDFDVATLASLGGILGRFDQCVARMRNVVRSGGYLVIDDGFLNRAESVSRPGYGHYASHERTLRQLTAHGDTILEERIYTIEETRAINLDYLQHITRRTEVLVKQHPSAAAALRRYVATQESECEFIDREITGAVWLLQRV